jgi:hypothetical protein
VIASQREALTRALSAHVTAIAADLRAQMLVEGPVQERAKQLHADEKVGDDFAVWTDLLSRRAAVLWVLKTVYVRVLEDRGLLRPARLADAEAQRLFEQLAPSLGDTAFLRWVFLDLASPRGGLPELFGLQPAELAVPADARSRALIAFWQETDGETGARKWNFSTEEFAGELMGDLYQELDPVVKERYALCQTPDFVRDFMLGQTLTPAIVELGADKVRLLDPACGSGHFLLDAMRRLVAATAVQHADWSKRRVVEHVLDRVVGIDLNDYACALARARMVMTAAELAGVATLADAAQFHPNVYWADGLEQMERDDDSHEQLALLGPNNAPPPRALLTRPEVRRALRLIVKQKFHVVVGNPPYITERDDARKAYHREMVGAGRQRKPRYVSAHREYSLAAPFVERSVQVAEIDGRIGLIVGNNFMKHQFGKPLIEEVIAAIDLQLVVDTAQAFIPHHGTPTVMLFAQNRAPNGDHVRAVMGKRGEPGTPSVPAKGKVWSSIVEGLLAATFENDFVSVAVVPRDVFAAYPWSLGGGGALELKSEIEQQPKRLGELVSAVGAVSVIRADEAYELPNGALQGGIPRTVTLGNIVGRNVREWLATPSSRVLFPYDVQEVKVVEHPEVLRRLWPFRTLLSGRIAFGKTQLEHGLKWFEYSMLFAERFRGPFLIVFANVATHGQFVLLRERVVVNSKAPVIKLTAGATEDDYLALLGLLNSSTACFWMKQVFHNKGRPMRDGGGGRSGGEEFWASFYEFDATKLKLLPIPEGHTRALPWARALDRISRERAERSVASVLARDGWTKPDELRARLDARRVADYADLQQMVALQEELDWECYRLFGIDDGATSGQTLPTPPNWRPFELDLATRDAETRAAIAQGDESTEIPTAWFRIHRWEPLTDLPADAPKVVRDCVAARRARVASNAELRLIEQPSYKRRWYCPDYNAEEQVGLALWLADRIEQVLVDRKGKPATLTQLTSTLEQDPRVHAVAELLEGRRDFKLTELVAELVAADAVPDCPFHIYKPGGLEKRKAWERTWEEQRKEDAGKPGKPEVPPKYGNGDFVKPDYFRLRGKLDVPKERFIAFTQIPGRGAGETLYGWAGWTPLERVRALLAIDEQCEDQGIDLADRIAVLDSAWRLVPDIARDDAAMGSRLRAELAAIVGADGPSTAQLEAWKQKFPPPTKWRGKGRQVKVAAVVEDNEDGD